MNAALYFDPDAYVLQGRQMMGRRAAGAAFLRAAVAGRGEDPLVGYVADEAMGAAFRAAVRAIDPQAPTDWAPPARIDMLARIGAVHRPDIGLAQLARLRLRAGADAFSITGVTHTLSSQRVLEAISAMATEPLMPWDAVICTSSVAVDLVRSVLADQLDYLRWRTGGAVRVALPQLPLIPLGIHSDDLACGEDDRAAARRRLGLGDGEVAMLFAGRMSANGKVHPFQMYDALRAVAARSERPIVLIQAGQFFNASAEAAFRQAIEVFATGVRVVVVDGADDDAYAAAFAGADIFLSLADSVQETFGLTPVEAMAAGMPVVVSDWNGYKDTVRDGIDGFRIRSRAPDGAAGESLGLGFELGTINYDMMLARASGAVSLDAAQLVDRLAALVEDPALRRTMGEAGRARARADYDWSVVYPQYRALWDELAERRRHASEDDVEQGVAAPPVHPAHVNIFQRFGHFPTERIHPGTRLRRPPGADRAAYERMAATMIFGSWQSPPDIVGRLLDALSAGPLMLGQVAPAIGVSVPATIELAARLAKMNLLILE